MGDSHPVLASAVAGFIFSLLFASIPVGPINLTILGEGARRGFRWCFMVGMGAASMDAIYCAVSFTGISQFIDHGIVKASLQVASFVFLLYLGFKFLMAPTVNVPNKLDAASEKLEHKLEQKFNPHSAYATGFVRVAANLGVLVTWVVVSAMLMAHDWVADTLAAKTACLGGVVLAYLLWFAFISYAVSRGHGKFSEKTLLRLQHVSGMCLIATAFIDGAKIAFDLAHHKI
ncbi:MAG TPA: LysE family transporter [Candidatus Sulfotelmatobacter sp.]|nr:LysE family transporter [Candidatus Sulfotelmatobacter sp.]